ncbi:MAG TPA: glycosyltransferase family 9 protein [Pirellula sp.]|nr:glycosyltransferase family 9 protein [Pirellula sp.]
MAKRILIVRLSAIGDCILSVPVLSSIRRNFPHARVGWVIEPASSQLIRGHSALDDLFIVSKRAFKSPRELWTLAAKLREWKPDITLDLQGLTKSSLIAWLSGAKSRLGFHRDSFDGRELSCFLNNQLYSPESLHIVDRNLELLRILGVNDSKVSFDLPEQVSDSIFAERTVASLPLEGRFAIINVGAGWVSKIWPSDRYASIAKHLGVHWGLRSLVVWSGEQEKFAAEQVVAGSSGYATLAPATTLSQLGSLIRRASLFVGSDTGPMHLSVAIGTPTIGLIGPMPIERVCPYGTNNVGVQNIRLLRESNRKTECVPMQSISTDEVQKACDRLMDRSVFSQSAS